MIKEVSIHKPTGITTYRVNDDLYQWEGEKKTKLDYKPTKIKVGFLFFIFKTVKVEFSNGMTLYFKGFPVVVEK